MPWWATRCRMSGATTCTVCAMSIHGPVHPVTMQTSIKALVLRYGVVPSIMSCQQRAFVGFTCGAWSEGLSEGFAWPNFSSSANRNTNNAHYRLYQADAWTVLSRPLSGRSAGDLSGNGKLRCATFSRKCERLRRPETRRPGIDLVTNPARADLWDSPPRLGYYLAPGGGPAGWRRPNRRWSQSCPLFHRCLTCPVNIYQRNEFLYPNPVEFRSRLGTRAAGRQHASDRGRCKHLTGASTRRL